MHRNVYFDFISVIIIAAIVGYYLVPWLWEKLSLSWEPEKGGQKCSFKLTPDNIVLAGVMLVGVLLILNSLSWLISYSAGYLLTSGTKFDPIKFYGNLIICMIFLLGPGAAIVAFGPGLAKFLFKGRKISGGGLEELNSVLHLVLIGVGGWLVLSNFPGLLSQFLAKIPEFFYLFSQPRGNKWILQIFGYNPLILPKFISLAAGVIVFSFSKFLSKWISTRYYCSLKEASDERNG